MSSYATWGCQNQINDLGNEKYSAVIRTSYSKVSREQLKHEWFKIKKKFNNHNCHCLNICRVKNYMERGVEKWGRRNYTCLPKYHCWSLSSYIMMRNIHSCSLEVFLLLFILKYFGPGWCGSVN